MTQAMEHQVIEFKESPIITCSTECMNYLFRKGQEIEHYCDYTPMRLGITPAPLGSKCPDLLRENNPSRPYSF